jgi:hypothetical protein
VEKLYLSVTIFLIINPADASITPPEKYLNYRKDITMFAAQISFDNDNNIANVSYTTHTGKYINQDHITITRDIFRSFLVLQGTNLFQMKQIQQTLKISPVQLQYILCNYDKLVELFQLTIDTPDVKAETEEIIAKINSPKGDTPS